MLMNSTKGIIDSQGISEEIITFIVAGYETISNTLNWTLFILGKYRIQFTWAVLTLLFQISDRKSFRYSRKIVPRDHIDISWKRTCS